MSKKLNSILLIDDDEPTNFLNKMILEEMDCAENIVVAQSGREAISYLTGGKDIEGGKPFPMPDLIFLDINMPAMDGWEFLEMFRIMAARRPKRAVMVMLTTSLNPEDEIRSAAVADITTYKNKPLSKKMMEEILQNHFNS
ncbi:MAG: response regulator [Bacteroidota bacterium]|nr:response regulator [Bacteroidota bacterium]